MALIDITALGSSINKKGFPERARQGFLVKSIWGRQGRKEGEKGRMEEWEEEMGREPRTDRGKLGQRNSREPRAPLNLNVQGPAQLAEAPRVALWPPTPANSQVQEGSDCIRTKTKGGGINSTNTQMRGLSAKTQRGEKQRPVSPSLPPLFLNPASPTPLSFVRKPR